MLSGAHVVLSSSDPDADRAFLRDVLELPHVDAGGGWLIFALPPAELAVHPAQTSGKHELYLTVADVEQFVARAQQQAVRCTDIQDLAWGRLTAITLHGGGELGVYEPRHERPAER